MRIDRACSPAPSLNLAKIRQRGAQLGADEVHVCLGRPGNAERALMVDDLRARCFGALSAEPACTETSAT